MRLLTCCFCFRLIGFTSIAIFVAVPPQSTIFCSAALAELVGGHLELLGQLAVAEDLDLAGGARNQAGLRKLLDADLRAVVEPLQLATR